MVILAHPNPNPISHLSAHVFQCEHAAMIYDSTPGK